MKRKVSIVFFLLLLQNFSGASNRSNSLIDSLRNLLINANHDTARINIYNRLAWEIREEFPDSTSIFCNKSLLLIEKLKNPNNNQYMKEWLDIATSEVYNNFGVLNNVVYENSKTALEYHLKALAIRERLLHSKNKHIVWKCKYGLGDTYKNIGAAYGDREKTIQFSNKALPYLKETKNKRGEALIYSNLGICYEEFGDDKKAIDYYNKALNIGIEINSPRTISIGYNLLGNYYYKKAKSTSSGMEKKQLYQKAIDYLNKGASYAKEGKSLIMQMRNINMLANIYSEQNNFKQALNLLNQNIETAKTMNSKMGEADAYYSLAQLYESKKDFANALNYFNLYYAIKDSATSNILSSQLNDVNTKFEIEKREREKEMMNQINNAKSKAEIKRQTVLRNSFIVGFIIMFLFGLFIYKSLVQKKKDNTIISEQKRLVDEKQKEILDSISYAKRLQEAILPPMETLNRNLTDNFMFYRPKDIVAGDFYWAEAVDEMFFIAVADSTGHGVPGAMVSVVCSNALNRSVKEFKLKLPGEILDKTKELVVETFEKSSSDVKDGMDISLLSIDKKRNKIYWSGANNPLWYIQNNEFKEIEATKQAIGKTDFVKPFITHEINYEKETVFYLFTDGYADQFGGPKGKKYKYKQLSDLLFKICQLSMQEQCFLIESSFKSWKGELEQVDDVCILGIKT